MRFTVLLLILAAIAPTAFASAAEPGVRAFNIPAGDMGAALSTFADQSELQLFFEPALVNGLTAPAVKGELSAREALTRLLRDSGLKPTFVSDNAVVLKKQQIARLSLSEPENKQSMQQVGAFATQAEGRGEDRASSSTANKQDAQGARGIPEILVTGSRVLNMDIRRSRDDPQPYSIFDRDQVERSGAASIEDFLKTRLTMNTQATTLGQQTAGAFANNSQINLRGLGASQTLILVDGRRQPSFPGFGNPQQADLNGIPLAAIERIEVLPTTASGIYGGSATGGVVNVILRRDYEGAEIGVKYEDSIHSDAPNQRVDLAAGFNLFGSRTNVLLAGSYMEGEQPKYGDRDFWLRGRTAILANTGGDYSALEWPSTPIGPVLGATPNIRSANGSNLVLNDGTPLGSPITHVPAGYAGLASGDGGAALVQQAGRYNIHSPDTAHTIGGNDTQMGQDPQLKTLALTVRQEITQTLQAFLQASASQSVQRFTLDGALGQNNLLFELPAGAAGNPFQQAVTVAVAGTAGLRTLRSETEAQGVTGGLIFKLPRNWVSGIDYTWSRSEFGYLNPFAATPVSARTAVASGVLDVFRDTSRYPVDLSPFFAGAEPVRGQFDATLKNASLRFAGPLWALPGGPTQLTMLAEYRDESLGDGTSANIGSDGLPARYFYPSRSQSIRSAYAELRMPWISAPNSRPGIQSFELQLAIRHDQYTTRGATSSILIPPSGEITGIIRSTNDVTSTDPTLALLYQPVRDITLRASYGTGFLPPSVGQIVPGTPIPGGGGGIDALRGNTNLGSYQYTFGGNPNLQPEDSESWSAGVIFMPHLAPGLRVSLDYVKIKKTNNIATPSIETLIGYFPERITRGPNLPGDPAGWAGPVIAIDATLVNMAKAQVEAYDLQLDYEFDTAFGRFAPFVLASRQVHFLQQFLPDGEMVENLGITSANPLKLKGNLGVNWSRGAWSAGWTARHFDSYIAGSNTTVNQRQGNGGRVASQTYHDVFATYRFGVDARALLADTDITLGIKNLFDEAPPFDANNIVNGFYSTFGDPRLSSYWLGIKKRF